MHGLVATGRRVLLWSSIGLAAVAACLVLVTPASAHLPDQSATGETIGNYAVDPPTLPVWPACVTGSYATWGGGLAPPPVGNGPALGFIGPPGTCIEERPCPGIPDNVAANYAAPGSPTSAGSVAPYSWQHIGHIVKVWGLAAGPFDPGADLLASGSDTLYHLEDSGYHNPAGIEMAGSGLMSGADGFFGGRWVSTITEDPAPGSAEVHVQDQHVGKAYCMYGAQDAAGPYFYMLATWGAPGSVADIDMSDWYKPLFQSHYGNGVPITANYFMLISSAFVYVPPPQVIVTPDPCGYPDPFQDGTYDQAPGVTVSAGINFAPATFEWDFGDGTPPQLSDSDLPGQTHVYADDGVYTVTVTGTNEWGSDTASFTCTIYNRAPTSAFTCPEFGTPPPQYLDFGGTDSTDAEGPLQTYTWDFGDGSSPVEGFRLDHGFPRRGYYDVTLTVTDMDDGTPGTTNAVTTSSVTHSCLAPDHPPVLQWPPHPSVPVGEQMSFLVHGTDPDGDTPLAYSVTGIPGGSSFDAASQTFTWRPMRTGIYGPFWFRVTDPFGMYDEKKTMILVYQPASDVDLDGIPDDADNCPSIANAVQSDLDHDGFGDACQDDPAAPEPVAITRAREAQRHDLDTDFDGIMDAADNCAGVANVDQSDVDGDDVGDQCDQDADGDGVPNFDAAGKALDNCPLQPNRDQTVTCDRLAPAKVGNQVKDDVRPAPQADAVPVQSSRVDAAAPLGLGLLALVVTFVAVFALVGRRMRE
ncbi:MAG: thrombospondin type 3 repeat-containing protein [Halobacteriales archaeon]|nr:thrombospondin type 3 repeat-containing protein [Halobacteriales archaeon]